MAIRSELFEELSVYPAALPFTRVLIASSSSCKVNSSDSKDLCSSVMYLEYDISIFGCFFITCVLPFSNSTWATWFSLTRRLLQLINSLNFQYVKNQGFSIVEKHGNSVPTLFHTKLTGI